MPLQVPWGLFFLLLVLFPHVLFFHVIRSNKSPFPFACHCDILATFALLSLVRAPSGFFVAPLAEDDCQIFPLTFSSPSTLMSSSGRATITCVLLLFRQKKASGGSGFGSQTTKVPLLLPKPCLRPPLKECERDGAPGFSILIMSMPVLDGGSRPPTHVPDLSGSPLPLNIS